MPSPHLSFAFQDGVLHLAMPGDEMRLRWLPEPSAERRLVHGRWEPFIPEFRILAPAAPVPAANDSQAEFLRAKQAAFLAFRATLPATLAEGVDPFGSYQWALLLLIRDSTSGPDLLRSNPVLAYALANHVLLRKGSAGAAAFQAIRHSHRKQREILGWLGFPATDAVMRVCRKVPPGIVHPGMLRKLREAVATEGVVKAFGHLPSLNTGVIYLACYREMSALTTSRLIQEVAGSPDENDAAPTADALQEIVTLAKSMGTFAGLRPFSSCRKVWEAHERILAEHRQYVACQAQRAALLARMATVAARRAEAEARATQAGYRRQIEALEHFPPPPVAGTGAIVPLTSFADLRRESARQQNCVGTGSAYATRVQKGLIYIYRVLAPEPHTLAIGRRGGGTWVIEELKGFKNKSATAEARSMVQQWLNAHQVSL